MSEESKQSNAYWEYLKECDRDKSLEERQAEKKAYQEHYDEKHRVW